MSSSSLKGNVPLRLWTHKCNEDDRRAEHDTRLEVQPDVDDDAHGPHVQRAVVAFVSQNLRSKICRRANHGTPEGLFPDDSSKSKVTEFDLVIGTKVKVQEEISCQKGKKGGNSEVKNQIWLKRFSFSLQIQKISADQSGDRAWRLWNLSPEPDAPPENLDPDPKMTLNLSFDGLILTRHI